MDSDLYGKKTFYYEYSPRQPSPGWSPPCLLATLLVGEDLCCGTSPACPPAVFVGFVIVVVFLVIIVFDVFIVFEDLCCGRSPA